MTRSPARRLQAMQTRATEYVRTSGMSVRTNGPPDGWMGTNGPVWWLGSDGLADNLGDLGPYGLQAGRQGPVTVYGGDPYLRPFAAYQGTRGVLPAITRATSIVVGPVIRTTWRYSEGTATDISDVRAGAQTFPRPLWIADPQLVGRIPGGEATRDVLPFPSRLGAHDFWRTLLTHALWFGAGALAFVEDAYGQPLAGTLRIMNPDRWGWTSDGRFVLHPDSESPVESDDSGYFEEMGPYRWRMVLIHGFTPNDGNVAEGALTRSGLLLQTGEAMGSYLSGIMASGVPAGVLKVNVPNFGPADAEELKTRWMQTHGGVKKSVAVLNAGVDFTPLQLSVVDSDVVNARGSWLVDVAHAFNLSSAYLDASTGSGGNITYANLSDRRRDLLDLTLADWGRSMEDLVTALLPYGQKMRVDWSGFLNTDPNQDLAFVKQGLEMGYLTPQEARDRLGLPPLDLPPPEEIPA